MRTAPILRNHDPAAAIGEVMATSSGIQFRFFDGVRITPAMFYDIFGNVGWRMEEGGCEAEEIYIKSGTILEFSFSVQPAQPAQPAPPDDVGGVMRKGL